ncbi:MAG: fused MFS/spermidine synthase [Lachnospiraceae bacterium]|nr:fused MFS/spermidine synthase [Lachnospiraceae bacterium]
MMDLFSKKKDRTPGKVLRTIDTEYGRFVIRNGTYRGEEARLYEVNDVRESASYFDERKNDLVFDYMKSLTALLNEKPDAKRILMFGGAGFQFPKFLISHYPEKSIDVVEINPLAVHLARKYFFLNDLEKDYKAESSKRLRIFIEDGMEYLKRSGEGYDIIINDAYHSDIPDEGLASPQGIMLIKEHLNPGGLYGFNLITALEGKGSMPFMLMNNTFTYHFNNVRYIRCSPDMKPESKQNILYMMSD